MTSCDAMPVVLLGCDSIHTIGMGYAIDVAFVDADGLVMDSIRGLPPGKVVTRRGASLVFERPASPEPWMTHGGSVEVTRSRSTRPVFAYEGRYADAV